MAVTLEDDVLSESAHGPHGSLPTKERVTWRGQGHVQTARHHTNTIVYNGVYRQGSLGLCIDNATRQLEITRSEVIGIDKVGLLEGYVNQGPLEGLALTLRSSIAHL
jgi:hypothetical protein